MNNFINDTIRNINTNVANKEFSVYYLTNSRHLLLFLPQDLGVFLIASFIHIT